MERGKITVTISGAHGAGKSYLAKKLTKYLSGSFVTDGAYSGDKFKVTNLDEFENQKQALKLVRPGVDIVITTKQTEA